MRKHIIGLIDCSGSMSPYEKETRESIVNIIKGLNPEDHFQLVYFDTTAYQIVANDLAKNIAPELGYLFKARGGTPITDALYKYIQDTTKNLTVDQLNEPHVIVNFNDGGENSSKYAKPEDVGPAIEHLTENFGWEFKFIGPKDQEASITSYANSIKIKPENLTLYSDVKSGLKEMESQLAGKS